MLMSRSAGSDSFTWRGAGLGQPVRAVAGIAFMRPNRTTAVSASGRRIVIHQTAVGEADFLVNSRVVSERNGSSKLVWDSAQKRAYPGFVATSPL